MLTGHGGQRGGQGALLAALRRRRGLRVGLVQLGYVSVAVLLAFALPEVGGGPRAHRESVAPLLLGISGGLISFIALVFSLLFLVVQHGNTAFSPRFTLFRDAPIVWHSFSYFTAVLVFCSTSAVRIGPDAEDVSAAVPIAAVVMVLVALGLSRALQLRALRSLQFNDSMEQIRRRGEEVLSSIYRTTSGCRPPVDAERPPVVTEVRWQRPTTLLTGIDLRGLLLEARRLDAVIEMKPMIGSELRRGLVVAEVLASAPVDACRVQRSLATGTDRKFPQDPLLAFRLLGDIGNRAMSLAVNDPATCVDALGCIFDLLAVVIDKQLDFGTIADEDGTARVHLSLPTWNDFLAVAVDEIAHFARRSPTVEARLRDLITDLLALAPADRRDDLETRLVSLTHTTTGRTSS